MGRSPCCDKANVKRGPWSPEEDATLKNYVERYGTGGNWIALPQKAGLKRCGKSCRLRWLNYLRPDIRHGGFTEEEDNIICSLYETMGSRWSVIASQLPGRTDNDVKNYWNTKLKKKMLAAKNKLGSDAYVQMNSASISSSSSPSPSSSSPPSASTITTIASKSVGPIYSFSNLSCTKPKDEAMVMPPVEVGFPYTAEAPKQNFESVSLLASSGFTAAAPQIFPDNKPIFPSQSHNSIDNSYISWLLSGGTEDAFPLMDHAGASAFELSNNYAVQEKKVFQVGEPTPVYNPNYNFSYGSVLVNPDSSQGLYSSLAHIL